MVSDSSPSASMVSDSAPSASMVSDMPARSGVNDRGEDIHVRSFNRGRTASCKEVIFPSVPHPGGGVPCPRGDNVTPGGQITSSTGDDFCPPGCGVPPPGGGSVPDYPITPAGGTTGRIKQFTPGGSIVSPTDEM